MSDRGPFKDMNLIAGREAEEDVAVIRLQKSDGKSQVRRSKGAGNLSELAKPWKSSSGHGCAF